MQTSKKNLQKSKTATIRCETRKQKSVSSNKRKCNDK